MGMADKAAKVFYSKPKNFISVVKLLDARNVIGEDVQEIKENLLVLMETLMEKGVKRKRPKGILQRQRDVVSRVKINNQSVIVGIENQQKRDYSEPVRVMLYDAMEYERQRQIIRWAHDEKKDLPQDEFAAGFSKKDKLLPVLTIVIYYGKDKWDVPQKLSDICLNGEKDEDAGFGEWIQDYRINVIDVRRLSDEQIEGIESEVRLLFGYVKYDGNKEKLKEFIEKNRKYFERLPKETYEIIANMTETNMLLEMMEENREEGGYNMCKAIDDMIKEGREEERQRGIRTMIEACKSVGGTWDVVLGLLEEKFSLHEEEGRKCMELYW